MRISAVNIGYPLHQAKSSKVLSIPNKDTQTVSQGVSFISFRGGNKDQIIYWGMELRPYNKIGGISTVLNDHRGLKASDNEVIPAGNTIDFMRQSNKVFVDPFYNGMEKYDYSSGMMQEAFVEKIPKGLKPDSAFKKYEGEYFYTNDPKFKKYANALDFFNNEEIIIASTKKPKLEIDKNIFILKKIGEDLSMDFGGDESGKTPVKLFRVQKFDKSSNKLVPINDFKIYTDVASTLVKPYEEGGYASTGDILAQRWKGDCDARSSKAFVELMEKICGEVSKDGKKFDPATVILNDAHAGNVVEYMARKNASGAEFWQGKKPELIIHNAGAGYIQRTAPMNMFINIADKELRDAVRHDPDFIDAMLKGDQNIINDYFNKLLPKEMIDAQGGVSPFQNTLYYAEKGFVPKVMTVSEGYHGATITNRDVTPGQFDILKRLNKEGVYIGITNGSSGIDPFSSSKDPYFEGYTFPKEIDTKGLEADEIRAIENVKGRSLTPLKTFDAKKAGPGVANFDIAHVREIKKHNKAALLERFDKDAIKALRAMQNIKEYQYDNASVMAAAPDRTAKIYGHIDEKFINEAKGSDSKVKLLISWGRGDDQKGLDSVMRSFAKFAETEPNTVLVAGGEVPAGDGGNELRQLIKDLTKDPRTKGRFVFMDGFAPNKPLIMSADFAVLPSRFAPCELTDLEAIKGFCPPIVTNCQGLAQKNFDYLFDGEAEKVTAYKTKHEFYMSIEDLRSLLGEKDREKFEKDLKKFKDEIISDHKHKFNKVLSEEEVMEKIYKERHWDYIFRVTRPYRDKVVESELVEAYERALIKDYGKDIQTKMIKNGINMGIGWENNANLSKFKKSSGSLYREAFRLDGKPVSEKDTLLYKLRENCKDILEKYKKLKDKTGDVVEEAANNKKWYKTKWAIGGAAVVAAAALGYAGYKSGWFSSSKQASKSAGGHISAIG